MKVKKDKTNFRVKINTVILVLVSAFFAVMTIFMTAQLNEYRKSLVGFSDAPAFCFNDEAYDETGAIEEGDICASNGEVVDNAKEYTIFLYNRMSFVSMVGSIQMEVLLATIGTIVSVASLAGAIIYWNHNKIN